MTDHPWLAEYPRGVPPTVDTKRYASLVALADRRIAETPAAPAFTNRGTTLTFGAFGQASRAFAAYLQSLPGLERGDRVAVMLPNLLQAPIVIFGVLRAGMVLVNVNPRYTPRELKHQLRDSGAKAIVVLENFACTLAEVIAETDVAAVVVTSVGDQHPVVKRWLVDFVVRHVKKLVPPWHLPRSERYRRALQAGARAQCAEVALTHDDLACLQYTGGTTGVAKGAVLTHGNLVSNVLQLTTWAAPVIDPSRGVIITALPLYHIFALTVNLLAFIELGGHSVLITDPRDFKGFVAELGRRPFTFISGVNTLFNALLHTPGFAQLDFGALQVTMAGGMAVQRDVAERWQKVTGCAIAQGYGLTEASPVVSANRLDTSSFNGSVGVPMPSTDVAIFDDDGTRLGTNEVGEICVRGPQVMREYWQRPAETTDVLGPDGWLRTGDVGRLDERGYLFIDDRKKDIIIVSGFKVFPNEVENVVTLHPGVREAAAIGIPDDESGERVKLVVVKGDPGLSEADVIAFCRENLTGYKVPKVVEFRTELPKTNIGKVLRRDLK